MSYRAALVNEEDEVQFALAEALGDLQRVLGPQAGVVLGALEVLVSVEETVVREQAAKSIIRIAAGLSDSEVGSLLAPMVLRLAQGERFSSKVSAVNLVSAAYTRAGALKEKLRQKFLELSGEDSPIVRRAIATQLREYGLVVERDVLVNEVIPELRKLAQDEQEQVRILCLDSLIVIAKALNKEENRLHTLPIAIAAGEDSSWKVRIHFAKSYPSLSEAFGRDITDASLVQTFAQMLKDNEADVKAAALHSLVSTMPAMSQDKVQALIFPAISSLSSDTSVNAHVRISTAETIAVMSKLMGKEFTSQRLVPMALSLLSDENNEVKVQTLLTLGKIASVVGTDLASAQVVGTISSLARESLNWRVRDAVSALVMELGQVLGLDTFTRSLEDIYFLFLSDSTQAVREAGVERTSLLAMSLGREWVSMRLLPKLREIFNRETGYLARSTILHILSKVPLASDLIEPFLTKAAEDRVPNVRFALCKAVTQFKRQVDVAILRRVIQPLADDPDQDVNYYARAALAQL